MKVLINEDIIDRKIHQLILKIEVISLVMVFMKLLEFMMVKYMN